MKTLLFRNLQIGRVRSQRLLDIDSKRDSVSLGPGIHLLVAPNGRGKTTLLQTLAGVLPPLGGDLHLGDSVLRPGTDTLYVSEYLSFPKFIYPGEWVEFMSGRSGPEFQREIDPWVDAFQLREKLKSYLGRMSQGERRKTTWLAAHASKKPVLLLDEPLDGLDLYAIRAARDLVQLWKREQRVVLVVAHQVGEMLDLADSVLLIGNQKLITWKTAMPSVEDPHSLSAGEFRRRVIEFYSSESLTSAL